MSVIDKSSGYELEKEGDKIIAIYCGGGKAVSVNQTVFSNGRIFAP